MATMVDGLDVPDPAAAIEWLAGLFPVRLPRGGRLALMFTDIEGFSAHAAVAGDGAAVRLVRAHDRIVLPALRRYGGRLLKRLGDGLMAAFDSAGAALGAALAMQAAAARAPVRLRIGIHAGTARNRDGDLVGHDVNVAARVADRAPGGAIVVSDAVRAAVAGLPAHFRRMRPLRIAGRDPVALFAVRGREGR